MRPTEANAAGRLLDKARAAHAAGDLAQAERGYKAVITRDPANADARHLLGFLLQQSGRAAQALPHLAMALNSQPHSASILATQGLTLHSLGRFGEALTSYQAALSGDPDNADLLNKYGIVLLDLGRPGDALAIFERVLASHPAHAEALGNRGNALVALNRPQEAIACYDAMRHAAGDGAALLTNRAHALRRLDRLDEALVDLDRALAIDPSHAEARFERGMIELACGDFDRGWADYESRFATAAFAVHRRDFDSPQWTGAQPLSGRTILLHAEQGFGDAIQFVRYAPLLAERGATVLLEVQPELAPLMTGAGGVAHVIARGARLLPFDLHCPLMSLPHAFGTRLDTIPAAVPYLAADDARVGAWRARLPSAPLRIGLCWAGRASHRNDANRSIPVTLMASLLTTTKARFVSLQIAPTAADRALLQSSGNVIDWSDELRDFSDTAALIRALDAVVTVDTSIAHLGGALGVPVLTLLPFAADFRWLRGRDDSPWYPGMRLFRQPRFQDWQTPLADLAGFLAARAMV